MRLSCISSGFLLMFMASVPSFSAVATAPDSGMRDAGRSRGEVSDNISDRYAVMHYDYAEEKYYEVYTAPGVDTDIQLQLGEKIIQPVYIHHPDSWSVRVVEEPVDEGVQQHVLVTSSENGVHTLMEIMTNQRTYIIDLNSFDHAYMQVVKWNYVGEDRLQDYAGNSSSVQ